MARSYHDRAMSLACVGINHRTAPVALRERFALGPEAHRRLLRERGGASEFVVLSTCNRIELYAGAADALEADAEAVAALTGLLADLAALPPLELQPHLYHYTDLHAVRHLANVAAGLDSMVPGEFEILGQVARACEIATDEGATGPLVESLFGAAARAGRRARAETGIGRLPTSISSEAVRLLADVAGPLERLGVLIVGTGKMGRLAGAALRAHGARRITVVSRTTRHAQGLAESLGREVTALAWHDLPSAIAAADAVLCSTGAPHAVITRELVERALSTPGGTRRRVFVDIAVPRDVEPDVGELPGVELFDLDALQQRLQENLALRRQEIPAVERIIEEEVARFAEWRRGFALRPLLSQMHTRSEAIRQRELQRMLRHLGDVPPALLEQLEAFSRSLVTKLLHEPTRRLRETSDPERVQTYSTVTRELFGLAETPNDD